MRLAISPRREAVPVAAKDNVSESRMIQETSGFKLYRPFDNVIEKSHLSAFKPVITSSNLSPAVPIDFSMTKDNNNHKEENDEKFRKNEEMNVKDSENESDDEVLDVDTIDDLSNEPVNLSEVATSAERPSEQSVIKTVTRQRQLSGESQNVTATLDEKICKLLDETTRTIQNKLEKVEKDSDDALNNNNGESCEMEQSEMEENKEDQETKETEGRFDSSLFYLIFTNVGFNQNFNDQII